MKPGVDFIGVGVFVLIFNNKNEILLVNHKLSEKKPEDFSDCWSMPGGAIEFGETVIKALKREIKEELGINIYNEVLLNYNDWIKEGRHWIALNFKAKTKETPHILEPKKIKEIKFFKLNKLPKNLSKFSGECLAIINGEKK
ncbi:MAG: NUDIX hydrolase [Patescibacteria group bacterium]|nr:NUDIX hydrolase [Patescibacteria group bacterium]